MILKFKPDKYYKSVYNIDFKLLKQQGIKLIACDLDNTLVPHDVLDAPQEVKNLIEQIKTLNLEFIILSNNHKKRVARFVQALNIKYYFSSRKPLKKGFVKLIKDYQLKPTEICLVGDQIVTDVFGANRVGITSVFVEPLAQRDILYTKLNRQLEKKIIKRLTKKGYFKIGEYYD